MARRTKSFYQTSLQGLGGKSKSTKLPHGWMARRTTWRYLSTLHHARFHNNTKVNPDDHNDMRELQLKLGAASDENQSAAQEIQNNNQKAEWDLKHLDDGDVNGNDGLEDGDADNKMKIENRNENMNWM